MREITEISSQKKKGDRLNIFLDGSFAFGVEYATAVKFGLKVGKLLTDDDIGAISKEEGEVSAFNRGLKYSVKRTVSEKQMRDYLARHDYSSEAINAAIIKLKSYGYVDDAKFAQAYVASYSKERGAKRLTFELKKAGVSDDTIETALSAVDEGESCDRCVQKYLRTHKNADRQKLINYLLYRGFDWDDIREALKEMDYEID